MDLQSIALYLFQSCHRAPPLHHIFNTSNHIIRYKSSGKGTWKCQLERCENCFWTIAHICISIMYKPCTLDFCLHGNYSYHFIEGYGVPEVQGGGRKRQWRESEYNGGKILLHLSGGTYEEEKKDLRMFQCFKTDFIHNIRANITVHWFSLSSNREGQLTLPMAYFSFPNVSVDRNVWGQNCMLRAFT